MTTTHPLNTAFNHLMTAIDQIHPRIPSGWISPDHMLPDTLEGGYSADVLVALPDGRVTVGYIYKPSTDSPVSWFLLVGDADPVSVVAWQDLPSAPALEDKTNA